MVIPTANLNYPLAIFAIFLRRVIDKFRRMPKNTILKKSMWYSCYMLSQEQWPFLVAALAISCTLARFYRSQASTAIVTLAKNKAGALNNSLRRRQWLQRRRSWLKQFHMRKTKEAPLKLGVSNLVTQIRNKQTFQDDQRDRSICDERCIHDQYNYSIGSMARLTEPGTDKSTYIGPSALFNKFCQTDEIEQQIGEACQNCKIQSCQIQNLRKSFSDISLVSNNNSRSSSLNNDNNSVRQEISKPVMWKTQDFAENFENIEKQLNKLNSVEREDKNKYMDPMCEILPLGCVHFGDFVKDDDNKSEEEEQSMMQAKTQPRKKKKRKSLRLTKRKVRRSKLKLHDSTSDSHLIRKTRSGRIYGYGYGYEKKFRGGKK